MYKKICPVCQKEFCTSANAQKFCSQQCRDKIKPIKNPPNRKCICKGCGAVFFTKRRRAYCNEDCRMYANGRGKVFTKKEDKQSCKYTLSQIAALANEAGMTYGRYVQKYSI